MAFQTSTTVVAGLVYKTKSNKMEPHFYHLDVNWNTDPKGSICSPEINLAGRNCVEVATPPEFPKGIAGIRSPEHLLTAAVCSCLITYFYP